MLSYEFAKDLIGKYGSPLVVYSMEQLEANYARLEKALPKNSQNRSSLKVTQKFNIIHTLSPAGMPGFFYVSAQFLCRSLSRKEEIDSWTK